MATEPIPPAVPVAHEAASNSSSTTCDVSITWAGHSYIVFLESCSLYEMYQFAVHRFGLPPALAPDYVFQFEDSDKDWITVDDDRTMKDAVEEARMVDETPCFRFMHLKTSYRCRYSRLNELLEMEQTTCVNDLVYLAEDPKQVGVIISEPDTEMYIKVRLIGSEKTAWMPICELEWLAYERDVSLCYESKTAKLAPGTVVTFTMDLDGHFNRGSTIEHRGTVLLHPYYDWRQKEYIYYVDTLDGNLHRVPDSWLGQGGQSKPNPLRPHDQYVSSAPLDRQVNKTCPLAYGQVITVKDPYPMEARVRRLVWSEANQEWIAGVCNVDANNDLMTWLSEKQFKQPERTFIVGDLVGNECDASQVAIVQDASPANPIARLLVAPHTVIRMNTGVWRLLARSVSTRPLQYPPTLYSPGTSLDVQHSFMNDARALPVVSVTSYVGQVVGVPYYDWALNEWIYWIDVGSHTLRAPESWCLRSYSASVTKPGAWEPVFTTAPVKRAEWDKVCGTLGSSVVCLDHSSRPPLKVERAVHYKGTWWFEVSGQAGIEWHSSADLTPLPSSTVVPSTPVEVGSSPSATSTALSTATPTPRFEVGNFIVAHFADGYKKWGTALYTGQVVGRHCSTRTKGSWMYVIEYNDGDCGLVPEEHVFFGDFCVNCFLNMRIDAPDRHYPSRCNSCTTSIAPLTPLVDDSPFRDDAVQPLTIGPLMHPRLRQLLHREFRSRTQHTANSMKAEFVANGYARVLQEPVTPATLAQANTWVQQYGVGGFLYLDGFVALYHRLCRYEEDRMRCYLLRLGYDHRLEHVPSTSRYSHRVYTRDAQNVLRQSERQETLTQYGSSK